MTDKMKNTWKNAIVAYSISYLSICLEGLRKITKTLVTVAGILARDSKRASKSTPLKLSDFNIALQYRSRYITEG
jgi:hypothetical protein